MTIFFHLTKEDWGKETILYPRFIQHGPAWPPRICVAPTIPKCLIALPRPVFDSKIINVYKTETNDYVPSKEYDANISDEVWLLKSHKFTIHKQIRNEHIIKNMGQFLYPNSLLEFTLPEFRLHLIRRLQLSILLNYLKEVDLFE